MSVLVPQETPVINSSRLVDFIPEQPTAKNSFGKLNFLTRSVANWQHWRQPVGVMALVLTISLFAFSFLAPHQPKLNSSQQQQLRAYLDENRQYLASNHNSAETQAVAADSSAPDFADSADSADSSAPANSPATPAELASSASTNSTSESTSTSNNKQYRYQLTLAQGFLQKAIDLSQQTKTDQTTQQKTDIQQYLDKALAAANQAIEQQPTQGTGFLVRARIYKTASVLDSSLAELSEQDKLIADNLGYDTSLLSNQELYDLLPTKQAQGESSTFVASPEENNSQITASAETNSSSGSITLPAGETAIFVANSNIGSNSTVLVGFAPDQATITGNASVRINQQFAGEGFTIVVSQSFDQPVTLDWRVNQ